MVKVTVRTVATGTLEEITMVPQINSRGAPPIPFQQTSVALLLEKAARLSGKSTAYPVRALNWCASRRTIRTKSSSVFKAHLPRLTRQSALSAKRRVWLLLMTKAFMDHRGILEEWAVHQWEALRWVEVPTVHQIHRVDRLASR